MTPFRDVFSALFFVSVGMLFNPRFVIEHPFIVLTSLAIVLVVKPAIALGLVLAIRGERATATTVAVGLAQIGEFSFILAALGNNLRILPPEALDALVVVAGISIALNPILFRLLPRFERGSDPEALTPAETVEASMPRLIISGSGDLARRVIGRCTRAGIPQVVVSDDDESLAAVAAAGVTAVFGDAARPDVLRAADIEHARALVVTDGTLAQKIAVINAARELNPRIAVIATASNHAEGTWLSELRTTFVTDVYEGVSGSILRAVREKL
jgi:CPA2 family monovalent cation:H+ antiporter-2